MWIWKFYSLNTHLHSSNVELPFFSRIYYYFFPPILTIIVILYLIEKIKLIHDIVYRHNVHVQQKRELWMWLLCVCVCVCTCVCVLVWHKEVIIVSSPVQLHVHTMSCIIYCTCACMHSIILKCTTVVLLCSLARARASSPEHLLGAAQLFFLLHHLLLS